MTAFRLFALAAAALLSASGPSNASDREPGGVDEVWAAYAARWSQTETYEAEFTQKIEISGVGGDVVSGGRFYFAKPDLMLWHYVEGQSQRVVGDGDWVWVYQPDLEQVYRVRYTDAFGSGGLVALMAARDSLSLRYRLELLGRDPETVRLRLVPRNDVGETLDLTLSAETMDLQSVIVRDPAGSVTRVQFHDVRRNVPLDDHLFEFVPPAGVDVVTTSTQGG